MVENKFRTIGYLILLAINWVMYYFLHSHFLFMVLLIMVTAPVISVVMAFLLRRKLTVEVNNMVAGENMGRQNEEAYICIKINNPSLFVCLDAKIHMTVENTFFSTRGTQIVSIPILARNGYELKLPIIPTMPGVVRLTVNMITVKDLMGFCFLKNRYSESCEIIAMPAIVQNLQYNAQAMDSGMLESEESTKKGNDFSDVQEIREYIPGDKLMSIHWKLSAKRDVLMVKDRASMSDKQLVVLVELCGTDKDSLATVLSKAYSVIRKMISDKITVRLMYWSAGSYEYIDTRIDYPEDEDRAFTRLFYEKTYSSPDEAALHMPSVYPEIKAYLHVSSLYGNDTMCIRENA